MICCFQRPLREVFAAVTLLLIAPAGIIEGQTLRGPDLGVWFRHEFVLDGRDAKGASGLVVDRVLEDGVFAAAGLRAGDRILSVDGQAIDSESQFVRRVMRSSNGDQVVSLVANRIARSGEVQLETISLRSRDVWKGVVAADPFYQAGLLVDERDAVVVARVFPLTPAFYAGLRQADTITHVSGQPVTTGAEIAQFFRVGGRLAIGVARGSETRQLHILLPGRTFSATTYPPVSRGQPAPPQVPVLQPPAPLLIPPPAPNIWSPIPSALPRGP